MPSHENNKTKAHHKSHSTKNHSKKHGHPHGSHAHKKGHKEDAFQEDASLAFYEFFVNELKELYSIETQIIEALPNLIKLSANADLKQALRDHLKETEKQVSRLEQIFEHLDVAIRPMFGHTMKALLKEGSECINEFDKSPTRDAAIISAAQKVEHYEIASYGSAIAHAECLNFPSVVKLLQETLDEEAAADKKLSKLAEGSIFSAGINQQAVEEVHAHA